MGHILKKILSDSLTPDEISLVYSAFDVIGSIVIVKIPDALKLKKQIIGEIILQNIKPAQSVFAQTSAVRGDYRIRSLEFIAGEYTRDISSGVNESLKIFLRI